MADSALSMIFLILSQVLLFVVIQRGLFADLHHELFPVSAERREGMGLSQKLFFLMLVFQDVVQNETTQVEYPKLMPIPCISRARGHPRSVGSRHVGHNGMAERSPSSLRRNSC